MQLPPHQGVVVEDAPRAVLAGEDPILERQVYAGRIDQVDDRDAVAHRDLLGAQNLGDGLGPPGAGLHGGVVSHHHRGAPLDLAHSGDHARRRRIPVVLVPSDEQPDLEEGGAVIQEMLQPLPRGQFPRLVLLVDFGLAAAQAQTRLESA